MDKAALIQRAKLAEQAGRYDDMASVMKEVAQMQSGTLSTEERNLLSLAYKNLVGAKRSAWRVISFLEKNSTFKEEIAREYRKTIEEELDVVCREVLDLLDKFVVEKAIDSAKDNPVEAEAMVFFLKMKGDYFRYLAEFASNDTKEDIIQKASHAYQGAFNLSQDELKPTNPTRLGLALNYSVFYYEIRSEPREACMIIKDAFDNAIEDLHLLPEGMYRDSTLIMQLLHDNLTLWTAEQDIPEEPDGE